jgi:hypothetical protein
MNDNRRGNAKRSTADDGAYSNDKREVKARIDGSMTYPCEESKNGLALSDFIAHAVVQFLGVRSLVRFGAACKSHAPVVSREVERRKGCIARAQNEVMRLTMRGLERQSPPGVPTRQCISTARKIVQNADRLIYDETPLRLCCSSDFFRQERHKFWPGNYHYSHPRQETNSVYLSEVAGSLYILPDCFYFPPQGESSSPTLEAVEDCRRLICYGGQLFNSPEIQIVSNGMIDAFRIVVRDIFFFEPSMAEKLTTTLLRADDLYATCWNENDSMSNNLGRMQMRSACRQHA